MRRALQLAVEQGKGREAAVLHNNLALATWQYEGPQAALAACREGVEFCERSGITEITLAIAATALTFLAACGRPEQALAEAEPLAERAGAAGDAVTLIEARSVLLRLLAQRGEGQQDVAAAEQLAASARETAEPQMIGMGFAAAAQVLLVQGRPEQARALLVELEQAQGTRADPYDASLLPELVRCALALPEPQLATRLAEGVEPRTPLYEHALHAARAHLAEHAGDHAQAATLHTEAAARWQEFGNVPERAHALLGQGRCLVALGKPEAEEPLHEARDLFAGMGYKPALAETEALLGQSAAAAL